MNFKCGHCAESCGIANEELNDQVVVSDCCRADVYLGGMIYSFWDYDQGERAAHAEYLREQREDEQLQAWVEEVSQFELHA